MGTQTGVCHCEGVGCAKLCGRMGSSRGREVVKKRKGPEREVWPEDLGRALWTASLARVSVGAARVKAESRDQRENLPEETEKQAESQGSVTFRDAK